MPEGDDWIYEIKFDGYRVLARIDADDLRLFTRNGNDWTSKLPALASTLRSMGLPAGWYDGEIVVPGVHGEPDFNALQNAFDAARTEKIQYHVFDVPYLAGYDLREVPLQERRAVLRRVLDGRTNERVRFSEDFIAEPEQILRQACRHHLEGVIGKRRDSTYVSRRSPSWIKLKCTHRQEFVIVGYTDPEGSRRGLGSLLLAIHDDGGALRYAGKVGTGFDGKMLGVLSAALRPLAVDKSPLADKPADARGHWVRPKLVAEVSFAQWTPDGRIRHSVFHGLRSDKPASMITQERPMAVPAATDGASTVKPAAVKPTRAKKTATTLHRVDAPDLPPDVRLTHPDRVIDATTGFTKRDLVNHYLRAARHILPHLKDRPVALVRAPSGVQGQLFFQKHAQSLGIADLTELDPSVSPGQPPMVAVDSFTALIGAAQMNVVEFHTWNATAGQIEQPDRILFDIDPGEGLAWSGVQEAAQLTRAMLDELGLKSFLKTSGGKGLHVVVPLVPRDDWDTVKDFSQAVVQHLARVIPSRFVAKSGPKNRVGKVFVDYLRNGRGATTACAYSARARAGLGVSIPVAWEELPDLESGAHWTIANAHERLEPGNDPWEDYGSIRQTVDKAMTALGLLRKGKDKR